MAKKYPRRTSETSTPKGGPTTYGAKRDFAKTPEPPPESSQVARQTEKKRGVFCVQKHDATRLHYDVRLEIAGALMSFAVPKGPSYDPQVKRLAVETEDHPMMYADFEARIPEGQYGAGDMILWDAGTYETTPPGQEQKMRAKGHLHVRFFGEKLRGGWHFVRTKGTAPQAERAARGGGESAKAQWLMFKADDKTADAARDILVERPESVKSGKSATRGPRRVGASPEGKTAEALVAAVGEIARASLVSAVDDVAAYWYEIKYDGYRLLAAKAGDDVRLVTRRGHDWTTRFPLVAQAIQKLPVREAVLDGEACVVDEAGRPSFQALQAWLAGESVGANLGYVTFDLLWVDGRDLRSAPIEERRELLEGIVAKAKAPLSFSRASAAATRAELTRILEAARGAGLEGIVAKRRGSTYVGGTSGGWRKLKFERRQDCVVVGWTPMVGAPRDLGALLLAVKDGGSFRYAGRVGTGFDAKMRRALLAELAPLAIDAATVVVSRKDASHAMWVKPLLVCEVAFGEWTGDGHMRRSSFIARRLDKSPDDCVLDPEGNSSPLPTAPIPAPAPTPRPTASPTAIAPSTPTKKLPPLTNAGKVLFPNDQITKRDILDYYLTIAQHLLPHLERRPLTLQRWPDGIDGEAWYQQNAPTPLPPFVHVATFEEKRRIIADNVETLAWLANLAALTLHQWSARVPRLEKPDYVVLDLDPGEATTWKDVIDVARAVRTLLDALSLESAVKTSGKRGIHVFVPLAEGPTHEEATAFAERIAAAVAKVMPSVATIERIKDKRKGRLYIDYLQNGEGKTIVAPYTIRALDGAPVSTPLAWSEVSEKLDPRAFTIRTVPERVAKHGDLFAIALRGKGRIL